MPFITETLWGALPHRDGDPELLIVARWPGISARDAAAEADIAQLIELIRGIRNARAEARLEASDWLPVDVAIPSSLGSAFEGLRPALERLARARPLTRQLTREALAAATEGAGGLSVIAGETEAVIRPKAVDAATAELERGRLEKELADAKRLLESARARLLNESFVAKAPPAVVEGARAREAELADQVDRLRERLGR